MQRHQLFMSSDQTAAAQCCVASVADVLEQNTSVGRSSLTRKI